MPETVTPAKELAWLAGLLEGEGCFTYTKRTPQITVSMTDRDVIERIARIFHKHVFEREPQGIGKLRVYGTAVHGSRAIQVMQTVYSLMGERRRTKIREVLLSWRSSRGVHWRRGLLTALPAERRAGVFAAAADGVSQRGIALRFGVTRIVVRRLLRGRPI